MQSLRYVPLERLEVRRPVRRSDYIAQHCRGKVVLDLGCRDETALMKCDTPHWLHGEIAKVATRVIGVDNSKDVPPEGIVSAPNAKIVRGDVNCLQEVVQDTDIQVLVAGELLEHLPEPLAFLRQLQRLYAGRQLLLTTPNATSLANVILATSKRESNHHDHLQVFSIKTLNTLCLRAGFQEWDILPYHVYFTEMILASTGLRRAFVQTAEHMVNWTESVFPMLSGGLILHVTKL
jgi:trans-aconitate methyltransferase